MKDEFYAPVVLAEIREARKVIRKRCTWERSRLVKYRAELMMLRVAGASYEDLEFWLRKQKRVRIDRSNIMRFLKSCK